MDGGFNSFEKYESQLELQFPMYGKMFQTTKQFVFFSSFQFISLIQLMMLNLEG